MFELGSHGTETKEPKGGALPCACGTGSVAGGCKEAAYVRTAPSDKNPSTLSYKTFVSSPTPQVILLHLQLVRLFSLVAGKSSSPTSGQQQCACLHRMFERVLRLCSAYYVALTGTVQHLLSNFLLARDSQTAPRIYSSSSLAPFPS